MVGVPPRWLSRALRVQVTSLGGAALGSLLALALSAAAAQPPAEATRGGEVSSRPVRVLKLAEALRLASERNLEVRKAAEERNQLTGKLTEERAAGLPQLSGTAVRSARRNESERAQSRGEPNRVETTTFSTSASQVLFDWGQVRASVRAAESGVRGGEARLRTAREKAAREVATAFYDLLLAEEVQGIAGVDVELRRGHLADARKRKSIGVGSDFEVLSAEVSLANAEPDLIEAENAVRLARDQLRSLLALDDEIEVDGSLEAVRPAYPSYEEAVEAAKKNRPELLALAHQVEASRALVAATEASDNPRLQVETRLGWQRVDVGERAAWGPEWSAAATVAWPLFDGFRTRGRVAQRRSELEGLRLEQERVLRTVALDVRNAANQVRKATETLRALSGVAAKAERLVNMTERGFQLGVRTKLDVDDAQDNLVRARTNLARARRDLLVAGVALEWTMGTLTASAGPVPAEQGPILIEEIGPGT